MFQDLDTTLTQVLNDPAAPVELQNADKSFVTPDKNFTPGQVTVNLFLYDVKENRELRDPVPIVEKVGNTYIRRQPPLRVDCSYIVTAWSNATAAVKVAEEHRLLSQVLMWLSRFPTLPSTFLRGSLIGQPFPVYINVAQMDPNKNAGEFWNALGISPRSAFYLTVTIALDLSLQAPEGPAVVTKEIRLGESIFQIGGRIFEAANPANLLDGAQVRLVEKGQTAMTDSQGQFTFGGLSAGNYTLQVSKTGFTDQTKTIVVPATTPNAYDVGIAP
jgi:hypothetical protein